MLSEVRKSRGLVEVAHLSRHLVTLSCFENTRFWFQYEGLGSNEWVLEDVEDPDPMKAFGRCVQFLISPVSSVHTDPKQD